MTRQEQCAELLGAGHLQSHDRDVLTASLGVFRNNQAGGDVGAAVVLVVGGDRQVAQQVWRQLDDVLGRSFGDDLAGTWIGGGVLEPGEHVGVIDAHGFRDPLAGRDEARDDRQSVATGIGEERGLAAVENLGDGRDLVGEVRVGFGHREAAGRSQMRQPIPQRGERAAVRPGPWAGRRWAAGDFGLGAHIRPRLDVLED